MPRYYGKIRNRLETPNREYMASILSPLLESVKEMS